MADFSEVVLAQLRDKVPLELMAQSFRPNTGTFLGGDAGGFPRQELGPL